MVERTDPAVRLRAIGRSDTPPLDADRLATIEARVMTAVASGTLDVITNDDDRDRRRPMVLVFAAAAVLVLAVFALVALAAGREPDGGLVLQSVDAVFVEAPGADPQRAAVGDELDDGAIVEVGPGGSASIDDVVYGPGRYLVDGGVLRFLPPATATGGDEPGGDLVPATNEPTDDDEDPAPSPAARPTTTTSRATTTVAPAVTRPAATTTVGVSPSPTRPANRATTTVAGTTPPRMTIAESRPAPTTTTAPPTTTAETTTAPGGARPATTTSTPTTTAPARGLRTAPTTTEPAR